MQPGLNVVAVPDSFKGSISALEVAQAMAAGARRALGRAATVTVVPTADGGEGTFGAILDAWHGRELRHGVTDALGRHHSARYGPVLERSGGAISMADALIKGSASGSRTS